MKVELSKLRFLIFFVTLITMFVTSAKSETFSTAEGHLFEVNLIPDKSEIMLGEPIFLSFEIKNLSNVDLSFPVGGDYRNRLGRPLSYSVEAVRNDGLKVPVPEVKYNFGGIIGLRKISANGGTSTVRLFLPLWTPFTKTGTYKISCQKNLNIKSSDKSKFSNIDEVGVEIKLETQLIVTLQNESQMNDVVDYWGKELLRSDYIKSEEAIKALDHINSKRVLNILVRAISNGSNFPAKDSTIRKLADFNEDESLEAIVSQMNSSANTIRSAVVYALSAIKNPKAFDFLLKMKNDKDFHVRLSVVQALGGIGTEKSIIILKKMLELEENKELIKYAEPYLKKEKQ